MSDANYGFFGGLNSWTLAYAADGSKILSAPEAWDAGYSKLMMSSDYGATWQPRDILPSSSHRWYDGAAAGAAQPAAAAGAREQVEAGG